MQKNDDQEWLDLLSEEIANKDKTDLDQSTKSLRRAIKDYDDMLNVSPELLAQGLDKLKFRLRKEGLTLRLHNFSINLQVTQWAMAASLFMALGMVLQAGINYEFSSADQEPLIYKSEGLDVIQIVSDPQSYLLEIEKNLNQSNCNYSVKSLGNDITLEISLNEKVVDYLISKRIEINEKNKIFILKIQQSK